MITYAWGFSHTYTRFQSIEPGRYLVQMPHVHEYLIVRKVSGTYLKTKEILWSRDFIIHFFHTLREEPGCFLTLCKKETVRKKQYQDTDEPFSHTYKFEVIQI